MPSRTPWRSDNRLSGPAAARRPSTWFSRLQALLGFAALAALVVGTAGCSRFNNPWKDSSSVMDAEMTTASADHHRGKSQFGRQYQRGTPRADVVYENGATTHWPLWFEDPFEDKGNRLRGAADADAPDTQFAWNWADYLHIGYGPSRMLMNIGAWPISAAVRHPGMLMESDGRISKGLVWKDHDARPSNSPVREPPDQALTRFANTSTESG